MIDLQRIMRLAGYWKVFALLGSSVVGSFIALTLGDISLNSVEMMKSLVQSEATILGFFGILAAYQLASFDTRIDRLDQQTFDIESSDTARYSALCDKISALQKSKKDLTSVYAIIGSVLIFSLIVSTITLGFRDINSGIASLIASTGFYSFFIGTGFLIYNFYSMSKTV